MDRRLDTEELDRYMGGIIREHGGHLIEIGGMADHVHVLTTVPARLFVSEMLRKLKSNSSKSINETNPDFASSAGKTAMPHSA